MVNPGHHLNKLGSARVRDAAYQVSRSSAFRFQRRRFLKDVTIIIWAWWPSWSCKQFEQAFVPSSQGDSTLNLGSIGQVVIEEKKFKNIESE